jgi:hypothetical protein
VSKHALYHIGDPGRAALELLAGPPASRIGRADVELTSASLPGMDILAAAARGLEHRANGTPRQDAFAIAHRDLPGEVSEMIAVVCDGVGGFDRSDEAADLVSRRLASLGAEGVPWPEAFARVNQELNKAVEEMTATDSGSRRMATTAVAVSVHRETNQWVGEAAWVGDSTLWHLSGEGQWTPVTGSPSEDAEPVYYSTDVVPLPSAGGACSLFKLSIPDGALFVMSDGVANPLRWSRDVQEALAQWWARPPDPFTFAAQVSFARKSHMDDRTVIAIWPTGGGRGDHQQGRRGPTDADS